VFRVAPQALVDAVGAQVAELAQRGPAPA
jgi:hypothetical protein